MQVDVAEDRSPVEVEERDSLEANLARSRREVDGTRTVLSNPGGAIAQNGATSFTAASSFGFFINCTDCIGGSASATVTGLNYTAQAIPEPSTYALMLLGALGVAGQIKRRKSV